MIATWQQAAWRRLWQRAESMPATLLFFGPTGIGKRDFAECLAQAVLCSDRGDDARPCGRCTSCQWFAHRTHPDVIRLSPIEADEPGSESKSGGKRASGHILIDQVRGLDDFLYRTTHLGGPRIVLIDQVETLYPNAANAFLKKLEEPPPDTRYLLITAHRNRLTPTILSRCCSLCPGVPSFDESIAWLVEQGVGDAEKWFSRTGSPLAAKRMAKLGKDDSSAVIDDWMLLPRKGVVAVAESIDRRVNEEKSPDAMDRFVTACQKVCHDLVRVSSGLSPRYHPDEAEKIARLAGEAGLSRLIDFDRQLIAYRQSARHPLNNRLVIEQLLLDSPFLS